jgi:hypothetical protein
METNIECRDCGLVVVRKLYPGDQELSVWLCPDCDPDNGEDTEPHQTNWMKTGEFGYDEQRERDWLPDGFQECIPRRIDKAIPGWIEDKDLFNKVIFSHPQSRRYAARWTTIAYLYFNIRFSATAIAEELELDLNAVKGVIRHLRERAERLAAKEQKRAAELMRTREMLARGLGLREMAKALKCSLGKAHSLAKLCKAA